MSTAREISAEDWTAAIRAAADPDGWAVPGDVARVVGVDTRAAGYWVCRRLVAQGLVEVRRESPRWWRVRRLRVV